MAHKSILDIDFGGHDVAKMRANNAPTLPLSTGARADFADSADYAATNVAARPRETVGTRGPGRRQGGEVGDKLPEAPPHGEFLDFCCLIAATALDILGILRKNTHELIVLPVFRRGSSVGPVFRLDRFPGLLMACGSESLLTIRWQQVASMPSGFALGREESLGTLAFGSRICSNWVIDRRR
jgi:hypothetical protein